MNKSQGHYFGRYDIVGIAYRGPDFSRRCFVFPGQGSAFPGMCKDEYLAFNIIREKFALADALVQKFHFPKISDYILHPDGLSQETLPAMANLALFTLESALCDVLISLKVTPEVITGHSFGEYTALVASGILPFEEMIAIIYHRDMFCPQAHALGFLIAVNADVKQVKTILGTREYHISNINSPRQTVIAVAKDAVAAVAQIFESKKIKHKVLYNVPQPYHSPYLEGSKKKIKKYLKTKQFSFSKPKIPFFSSVLKKLIDENNFKKEDIDKILINQITTQVDFISQSKSIYDRGCSYFLEVGPKKLFAVFIDDIMAADAKEVKTDCALGVLRQEKQNDFKPVSLKGHKLFTLISQTIGKITGYEIEKIYPEGRFQEDLGIDSIKRADILLTVFDELKILLGEDFNTSEFKSINDVIAYIEKAKEEGRTRKALSVGAALAQEKTRFKRYIFVPVAESLPQKYFLDASRKDGYFLLPLSDIVRKSGDALERLRSFCEALGKKMRRPDIIILADGIQFDFATMMLIFKFFREYARSAVEDGVNVVLLSAGRDAHPYIYGLASFLKSLKKEFPGMFFKHIHYDRMGAEREALRVACQEARETDGMDVVYKNGKRFVLKPRLAQAGKKPNLNESSVVVAIGGAKGITFSLIKNISRKYKPVLYLAGKSREDDKVVRAHIEELKKENPNIYYASLDACDMRSLDKLFASIKKQHKKIDLVINGAGTVKIGFLKEKTDEDMESEFYNKVLPAFHILNLASKYKPKRIIHFSSIISRYGSAGQSVYTAANELVSGLTAAYATVLKKSGTRASVVHWPPWDSIGMTGNQGVSQKLKEAGVSLLGSRKADTLFLSDLSSPGEGAVYYLDEADDRFYSFALNNLEPFRSLIGEIADPFSLSASRAVFRKIFDLQSDTYLKDHMVRGTSYVPAAVGIGMFLCLGKMYGKRFPVLKNIAINNPIIVKERPAECLLETTSKDGLHLFSIKSYVPHFSAEAAYPEEKKIPPRHFVKRGKKIEGSTVYADYALKNSLFLGTVFQSIERIWIGGNNVALAVINNSVLLPVFGLSMYDRLIQWIDASFQALGVAALRHDAILLPVGVASLSFFPNAEISQRVYAIPSSVVATDAGVQGDVALVNEKGEVILDLVGIFLKKTEDNQISNEK
ncbi:MAG: SDR family NAD(P)-dependent oxidoreductase [Candidatus Moraniibacteriota bacterium]